LNRVLVLAEYHFATKYASDKIAFEFHLQFEYSASESTFIFIYFCSFSIAFLLRKTMSCMCVACLTTCVLCSRNSSWKFVTAERL